MYYEACAKVLTKFSNATPRGSTVIAANIACLSIPPCRILERRVADCSIRPLYVVFDDVVVVVFTSRAPLIIFSCSCVLNSQVTRSPYSGI